MARFAACAFLAVLAVIPSLALARSLNYHPHGSRDAPSNADGIYFSIRSVYKADDVENCADVDDNGNVVMMDCDETSDKQLWFSEGTAIKHFNTGKCMEVCVTNCKYFLLNRRRIWIKDCTGSDAQQFVSIDGSRIQSVQNGNCLDLCKSTTCTPLGDLITYPCQDDTNQQWYMVPGTPQAPSKDLRELVDFAAQTVSA